MFNEEIDAFIKDEGLVQHEEGGYFKVTYVSPEMIQVPSRYDGGERPASSKIDYLLVKNDFSAWHRIKSNETWRFKDGSSLTLHIIQKDGTLLQIKIGDPKKENDAFAKYTIEYGQWFSASVNDTTKFSYVECEVSPGFDYRDWEFGKKEDLIKKYPAHRSIINHYSRETFANAHLEDGGIF